MESPNKRPRLSPPADFVPLNFDEDDGPPQQHEDEQENTISNHLQRRPRYDPRSDPRHARDRPKHKQPIPDHDPWILIKTKYGRKFIHNTQTKESLWRMPKAIWEAVKLLESEGALAREKAENARWAEEQLREMRGSGANAVEVKDGGERARRRRSESLQREDEEAMMKELAREAEKGGVGEDAVMEEVKVEVKPMKEGGDVDAAYGSDSSYEEIEVTDSEFEDDEEAARQKTAEGQQQEDAPVEFGEDDIAYQLAAMEEDAQAEEYEEEASDAEDEPSISHEEAVSAFRALLSDHNISPFIPWESLLTNTDLLYDDRWTLLPTTSMRKSAWEAWVRDAAAARAEERKRKEFEDPRIPFLRFLEAKANGKLFWVEFKRKFGREAVMQERKLGDKGREKIYREFVARLKLPETRRRVDLGTLLASLPLRQLNGETSMDGLPQGLISHLHYYSLQADVRDPIVRKHISGLPPGPAEDDEEGEVEKEAKQLSKEAKAARALADRERQVDEQRRRAEKEERWAKREALEAEREVREAMNVRKDGIRGHL